MITIQQELTKANLKHKSPSKKLGVAIHETANTAKGATTAAHARLQKNPGNYGASWNIRPMTKKRSSPTQTLLPPTTPATDPTERESTTSPSSSA